MGVNTEVSSLALLSLSSFILLVGLIQFYGFIDHLLSESQILISGQDFSLDLQAYIFNLYLTTYHLHLDAS